MLPLLTRLGHLGLDPVEDDGDHARAESRLFDGRGHQVAQGFPGEAGEVTAQGADLEE